MSEAAATELMHTALRVCYYRDKNSINKFNLAKVRLCVNHAPPPFPPAGRAGRLTSPRWQGPLVLRCSGGGPQPGRCGTTACQFGALAGLPHHAGDCWGRVHQRTLRPGHEVGPQALCRPHQVGAGLLVTSPQPGRRCGDGASHAPAGHPPRFCNIGWTVAGCCSACSWWRPGTQQATLTAASAGHPPPADPPAPCGARVTDDNQLPAPAANAFKTAAKTLQKDADTLSHALCCTHTGHAKIGPGAAHGARFSLFHR